MNRYAIIENDKITNFAVADAPLDENWKADPPNDACVGWLYRDGEYERTSAVLVMVGIQNVQFSAADFKGGIYCITEGVSGVITADMIPHSPEFEVPAGEMRVIIEKQMRGQTVSELPFTATITAANGAEPARLSLPVKLSVGFYLIIPERQNIGLANPKINAPYRLSFDAIDIDCVGAT